MNLLAVAAVATSIVACVKDRRKGWSIAAAVISGLIILFWTIAVLDRLLC